MNYKFNEKSYKYRMFANLCLEEEQFREILNNYDIIISVPISKKRLKERGYNQSELIAKEISKKIQIQYKKNILLKTRNTVAQSTLNKEQREENARGIYEIRDVQKIYNKKILLVDDIYTTGSTVNECGRILKESNPQKIGILTLAKD